MSVLRVFERQAAVIFSRTQPLHQPAAKQLSILHPSRRALSHQSCRWYNTRPSIFKQLPKTPLRNSSGRIRYNSSTTPPSPNPTPNLGSPEPALSLSQRLKKLSREYGWSAVGVYFALSALDFPFCFLAVRLLGTDRIGRWEHAVLEVFWSIMSVPFPTLAREGSEHEPDVGGEIEAAEREGSYGTSSNIAMAEKANSGVDASFWTQFALAYAIHKSFIFIRVPLTAAILPKVVKTLRGWGWDIGKRRPKVPKATPSASTTPAKPS